jgi:hypothetical protein
MADIRKFQRGHGKLTASVINEIVDRTRKNRQDIEQLFEQLAVSKPDRRFIGRSIARGSDAQFPIDNKIGWAQVSIQDSRVFAEPDPEKRSSRSIPPGDDFRQAAFLLTPPMGLLQGMKDDRGGRQIAWIPVPTVLMAKVTSATGGIDATYVIQTVDDAIEVGGLTPIDRWDGITYIALPLGADCLMLITDPTSAGVKMVGFETPEFAQCPPGVTSGIDSTTFVGL